MLLFAGLGNPGSDYAGNRHNVGFMAIDAIAARHGFSGWKTKGANLIAEGRVGTTKVVAIKPQSFMTRSISPPGESGSNVAAVMAAITASAISTVT